MFAVFTLKSRKLLHVLVKSKLSSHCILQQWNCIILLIFTNHLVKLTETGTTGPNVDTHIQVEPIYEIMI